MLHHWRANRAPDHQRNAPAGAIERATMEKDTAMTALDAKCNDLARKLDAMKAVKQDSSENLEYMQTLYDLRDACRQRTAGLTN